MWLCVILFLSQFCFFFIIEKQCQTFILIKTRSIQINFFYHINKHTCMYTSCTLWSIIIGRKEINIIEKREEDRQHRNEIRLETSNIFLKRFQEFVFKPHKLKLNERTRAYKYSRLITKQNIPSIHNIIIDQSYFSFHL